MTDREKIAARIRALLAKTTGAGCSEAEALAAAELAAKLLAQYRLTLDEVELRASPFTRHQEAHDDQVGERLWKPAVAIADLTGAVFWTSGPGVHPVQISFFGFAHEVEISTYLLEICARAMRQQLAWMQGELTRLRLFRPAARQLRLRPFLDGMADRLAQRILALKPAEATGTGLIILRGELLNQALAEAGIQIKLRQTVASRSTWSEYRAGQKAADDVALNPGLRGRDSQGRLST